MRCFYHFRTSPDHCVCNSLKDLSWCFFTIGDALICRASVYKNNYRIKYLRAFTFVAEVVENFFAGVSRFNNNIVFFKYGCFSFLESYWTTTNVNCCEKRAFFNVCISHIKWTSQQVFRRITDHCGADKNSAIFDHLFNYTRFQNSDIIKNFKTM